MLRVKRNREPQNARVTNNSEQLDPVGEPAEGNERQLPKTQRPSPVAVAVWATRFSHSERAIRAKAWPKLGSIVCHMITL